MPTTCGAFKTQPTITWISINNSEIIVAENAPLGKHEFKYWHKHSYLEPDQNSIGSACYLRYCNAHSDLRLAHCGGELKTCESVAQTAACRAHWLASGINDATRLEDPA